MSLDDTVTIMPLIARVISRIKRLMTVNGIMSRFLFHGGEPFLAFERIKEICKWLWSQEWPCKYICFATTNGILVHGEIKRWLMENKDRFIAGLSLDGTPEMHNRNRSDSYSHIDVDFFCKTWPAQGVKITPSPETIDTLADGVIYIHELGFTRNNCSFASGVDWTRKNDGTALDYKNVLFKQFVKLAEYYLGHPDTIPVDMLNIRFAAIAAGKKAMKTKLCGAGTIMRCWTLDGQCLPCHLFYEYCKQSEDTLPEFQLTVMINLEGAIKFINFAVPKRLFPKRLFRNLGFI